MGQKCLGDIMIPRVHSRRCATEDFPEIKKNLELKGYSVYDPVISNGFACFTFIRSEDINHVALQVLKPGNQSE